MLASPDAARNEIAHQAALLDWALTLREGVTWVVRVWAGANFLVGIVGLLASYLAEPPPTPEAGG